MLPHPITSPPIFQELNNRLAAEITRLRTLLTGEGGGEAAGSPLTQGKDAYELEVSPAAGMRARGPPGAPVLPHGWYRALGAQWDREILGSQSSFFPILGFVPWLRGPQVQWVRVWGAVWCPQGCDHAASVPPGPAAGQRVGNPVPEAGDQLSQRRAADSTEGNAGCRLASANLPEGCAHLLRVCASISARLSPDLKRHFIFAPN